MALFPAAVSQIIQAVFIAYEQAEYVTYGTLLESLLRVGLSLAVLIAGYGLFALFVVLVVANLALLLYSLIVLRRKSPHIRWQVEWPFLKRMVRQWRVYALETWVSTIYGSLGVILLSGFVGRPRWAFMRQPPRCCGWAASWPKATPRRFTPTCRGFLANPKRSCAS